MVAHQTQVVPASVPITRSDMLSQNLLLSLYHESATPGFELQLLGPFFAELPTRFGHNKALDSATEAFLLSHNMASHSREDHQKEITCFNKAMADLRQVSADTLTCETIAAATILYSHHIIRPGYTRALFTLSNSVSNLIETIGPAGFRSSFGLALLQTHCPTVIMLGLISGRPTIFSREEWIDVLQDIPYPSIQVFIAAARLGGTLQHVRMGQIDNVVQNTLLKFYSEMRSLKPWLEDWESNDTRNVLKEGFLPFRLAACYCGFYIIASVLLTRIGLPVDVVELRRATKSAVKLLQATRGLGTYATLHATLTGPAAWGMATEPEKRIILDCMTSLPTLADGFGANDLSTLFILLTGGTGGVDAIGDSMTKVKLVEQA